MSMRLKVEHRRKDSLSIPRNLSACCNASATLGTGKVTSARITRQCGFLCSYHGAYLCNGPRAKSARHGQRAWCHGRLAMWHSIVILLQRAACRECTAVATYSLLTGTGNVSSCRSSHCGVVLYSYGWAPSTVEMLVVPCQACVGL